jgi:hypothetical protein
MGSHMNTFQCRCGNALFFENTACLRCRAEVGYECGSNAMVVVDGGTWKRCENGEEYHLCNWVVGAEEFRRRFSAWVKLAPAINELAAGLGHPDLFPFIFTDANLRKLDFVDRLVRTVRRKAEWVQPRAAYAPERIIAICTTRVGGFVRNAWCVGRRTGRKLQKAA